MLDYCSVPAPDWFAVAVPAMLSPGALGGLLLAISIGSIWAASFDVMFEKFEQHNGTEMSNIKLRVRKYNRTISVLAGNVDLKVVADNTLEVTVRLWVLCCLVNFTEIIFV